MTESSVLIAGFGGQGILLAGEVLATALMNDDKNVTWYPSYGAEMRGGTVNCAIVTSDEEVSSVSKKSIDFLVALNQLSFDRFLPKIKKGGWVIANSSLTEEKKPRPDINYIFAPITDLANKFGEVRIANIISLGLLAKISKLTSIESLHSALEHILPEHRKNLLPLNLKALEAGFNYGLSPVTVNC